MGNAIIKACADAKRQLFELAAKELEADQNDLETADAKVFVKGSPERSIEIKDIERKKVGVYLSGNGSGD